jgi:hypothetical protein
VGEDDTEAQKTALVLATPPRKPGTCVEMSALGHLQTLGGQASVPSAAGFPFLLLSIIRSDVSSELVVERINFLLDIVDFGQRPEPRSSKHEFRIEQFQG